MSVDANAPPLPTTSGFVLWLIPEGPAKTELAHWMEQMAKRLGGPTFAPHITLMGGLKNSASSLQEEVSAIAQGLPVFEASTEGVAFQEHPFRACCLPVAMSPGLWRARTEVQVLARDEDQDRPLEPYFPHISLYYGYASLQERLRALGEFGPPPQVHFPVTQLHLVSAEGGPEDWRVVDSAPLQTTPPPDEPAAKP